MSQFVEGSIAPRHQIFPARDEQRWLYPTPADIPMEPTQGSLARPISQSLRCYLESTHVDTKAMTTFVHSLPTPLNYSSCHDWSTASISRWRTRNSRATRTQPCAVGTYHPEKTYRIPYPSSNFEDSPYLGLARNWKMGEKQWAALNEPKRPLRPWN